MNIIIDTNKFKIYNDKINDYDIFYTIEDKKYPYYLLTKIEVYKENILYLYINCDIRDYNNTMGAEYSKININTTHCKRIIELDGINNVTSDTIYGNKNELDYYEKTIFNGSIINHLYKQKNYFTTLEMHKSISLYERIKNKLKNKKS